MGSAAVSVAVFPPSGPVASHTRCCRPVLHLQSVLLSLAEPGLACALATSGKKFDLKAPNSLKLSLGEKTPNGGRKNLPDGKQSQEKPGFCEGDPPLLAPSRYCSPLSPGDNRGLFCAILCGLHLV